MTREEITVTLEQETSALVERYRAMPDELLHRPCTDSQERSGERWTPKDHLAHLTYIERAFQAMIERHLAGKENPVGLSGASRDEIMARVHKGNEDNVAAHRADDLETLLADHRTARVDTLALVARLSDEQLSSILPGAPWNDGTIGGVVATNAHHAVQHLAWIDEGLAAGS
ncbi:MAG: hypothetical protein NVS3B21_11740 [Acidimicrobiales bacterium]